MTRPKTRLAFDTLEGRSLLAVIFDIDGGSRPTLYDGRPTPANVTTYPYDFATNVAGPPVVTLKHGSLMAQQAIDAGFTGTFVELKATDSSGYFSVDSIASAMDWVAKHGPKLYPHQALVVTCPASGAGDGTASGIVGSLGFLAAEKRLAKAGIPVVLAAGNGGANIESDPWFPAISVAYARPRNVLTVAATGDDGHLQPYSNYGPSTVAVAARTPYGTSGAAILGGVAMAQANPRPKAMKPAAYARAVIAATVATAIHDAALDGLVSSGGELPVVPAAIRVGMHGKDTRLLSHSTKNAPATP